MGTYMRLKLLRYGNVFNPSFIIISVILIVILSLFSVLNKFRWDFIISSIAVVLIYMLLSPLNYPKYIELKDCEINYIEPISLMSKYGVSRKNIKVKYCITDITKFKLEQNKIEHLFGMAHIIF